MSRRVIVSAALLIIAAHAEAAEPAPWTGWHPYAGVSVGTAWVHTGIRMADGAQLGVARNPPTLGLFAGVRPFKRFGFEVDYFDFAAVNAPARMTAPPFNNLYYKAEAKAWSLGAFAVGYLPLGKSPFELYGKFGGALVENRQRTLGDFTPSQTCVVNTATGTCTPLGVAATDTTNAHIDPAAGVGVQYRAGDLKLRLDIQRSYSVNLNPTSATLGVAYSW